MTSALRNGLILLGVAVAAGAGGYYASRSADPAAAAGRIAGSSANVAKRVPPIMLIDMEGKAQKLSQWQGKVLVVNFWATWCPPCIEEIPEFAGISRQYADKGVQFVGISTDSADKVRAFLRTTEVPYPNLIGDFDTLDLVAELGNPTKGLPFTLVVGRDGAVQYVKVGRLRRPDLEKALLAALERR